MRTRKRIRELSTARGQSERPQFEKAELPASETTRWDRLWGKRKVDKDGKMAEMPAADETRMRAEMEGTIVEPKELAAKEVEKKDGPQ